MTAPTAPRDLLTLLDCSDPGDLAPIGALAASADAAAAVAGAPAVRALLERAARKLWSVAEDRARDPVESLAAARRLLAAACAGEAPEPEPAGHDAGAAEPTPAEPAAPAPPVAAIASPPSLPPPPPSADAASDAGIESDPELIQEFVSEAQEYLAAAEQALLVLEGNPDDRDAVDTVFRAFHTIKGVAAVLGFAPVAEFAHRAESLLAPVRDRRVRFGGDYASLALRAVDMLRALVDRVAVAPAGSDALPAGFTALMDALEHPEAPAAETPPAAAAPRDAEGGASPQPAPPPPPADSGVSHETWVRVRTDRLDQLMDIVGELVIAQSMVAADPGVLSQRSRDLARKVAQVGKTVRELQDLSLSLRMVPLRATFQKMTRVVRDTARRVGRQVELVTDGEETELDRKLVDALADPLVHMVRNAVDHGIEPPAARIAGGKPPGGTVRLRASHAGGNVVVQLSDDGAGLDRDRLVARALERGLLESGDGLSEQDAFQLIFEPGFSTAASITDVSGRGVGMDVVRRAIESLNGRVEIASVRGRGTTFTVRIPLTLAITDGMLVRVGGQRYIVPSASIRITLRPEPTALRSVAGRGELVMLRGEAVPLFRLSRIFGLDGAIEDPTQGLVVVLEEGDGCSAFLVDDLLGKQQVVTKSLGEYVGKVPGVSGGAILGDGRVGLILDPPGLTALARQEVWTNGAAFAA
ncbi:MAG: chemotaxis protein CheA [Polyangiaceae bacterium]|nr:chemotaxis protein CheA [Polyangiaceae bacterium]